MAALILDASVLIGLLDSAAAHHERAIAMVLACSHELGGLLTYDERLARYSRADR